MIFSNNNNPKRQQPQVHKKTDTERIAQDFMVAKLEEMQQAHYQTNDIETNEEIENEVDHEIDHALDCLLNNQLDQDVTSPTETTMASPTTDQTQNTKIETTPEPVTNQPPRHTHAHYENPQLLDEILSSIVDTHIQKQTKRLNTK